MQRVTLPERPAWRSKAEELGFHFHTMYGEPYWDETSAYAFTLDQIEIDIEDPSNALHAMCLDAVEAIVASEDLLSRLGVPGRFHDHVVASWTRRDPALYGRLDLAYRGSGPAKLLEYNADTPTSLYEAASFQWTWLEDMRTSGALPADADQFNASTRQWSRASGRCWRRALTCTSPPPKASTRTSPRWSAWPGPPRRPASSRTMSPWRTSASRRRRGPGDRRDLQALP